MTAPHIPELWLAHGQYVITGHPAGPTDARCVDHANLMAAAPRLLAALTQLVARAGGAACLHHPGVATCVCAIGEAVEAVAEARGES